MRLLGRLDQATEGDSAWQALYVHPERQRPEITHRGRCGLCRTRLGRHDAECPQCHACWQARDKHQYRVRYWLFGLASMAAAFAIGGVSHIAFTRFLEPSQSEPPSAAINHDFLLFMDSYLWVFTTVLVLILSTYLFEILDLAPRGRWVAIERSSQEGR
jgi:hypothetical protein